MLPSTVVFAAGQYDYIAQMNQLVADMNAAYQQFLTTLSPAYFVDTSATSNTIGTGSKSFTLASGSARAWTIGTSLRIADSANPSNYMEGQVTAYAHPNITVNVATTGGSGTKTAWSIGLAPAGTAITNMTPGSAAANQHLVINGAGNTVVGLALPNAALYDDTALYLTW